jgi:peptide/nickel transport system permease protein
VATAFRRNKLAMVGAVYLLVVTVLVLVVPRLPLPQPDAMDFTSLLGPPSAKHPLGTDENGRDIFVRLVYGARISLLVAVTGALLTVAIGSTLGLIAGYFGGAVEQLIMRFTDGMMSIPIFFLVLAVVAILGSSVPVLVLTLALTRWMGVARLVRSEVLRNKNMDFVLAARSLGARDSRIMLRHLLPAAVPLIIVTTSLGIGEIILVEAGLSFLGLGILPPTPSWGNMLSNSQVYIWTAPQLAIYPGLLITMAVLAFNSIGDVLRDLLDPRRRRIA